jgi:hypothetical protein
MSQEVSRMQWTAIVLAASLGTLVLAARAPQSHATAVPRTWDDAALAPLEVPSPHPAFTPKAVPAEVMTRLNVLIAIAAIVGFLNVSRSE